jgi:hypothetical protein
MPWDIIRGKPPSQGFDFPARPKLDYVKFVLFSLAFGDISRNRCYKLLQGSYQEL